MTCSERQDLILLYAAGVLEGDERDQLRAHLASGCPRCAGALAEAEATLAQLPFSLDVQAPPPEGKKSLLKRIAEAEILNTSQQESFKIGPKPREWDRIILPAALAAVLAVAVTLAAIWRFKPSNELVKKPGKPDDVSDAMVRMLLDETLKDLADKKNELDQANAKLTEDDAKLDQMQKALTAARNNHEELASMKLAQLKGDAQPDALGRVFIDTQKGQWYFFTSGMKPANQGKTYELWLIAGNQKIPAGTFDVNPKGSASLLGTVPALPKDAAVVLAVTDEPAGPMQQQPTGTAQISGPVQ